jgi:hypothetical protein
MQMKYLHCCTFILLAATDIKSGGLVDAFAASWEECVSGNKKKNFQEGRYPKHGNHH